MFPFLMNLKDGGKKTKLQVETDTGCHFNIAGSEVIFYT